MTALDEEAWANARQPLVLKTLRRMQAGQVERFVTSKVCVKALVGWRDLEKVPVRIERHSGKVGLQPLLVVGAHQFLPLGVRDIERSEADGRLRLAVGTPRLAIGFEVRHDDIAGVVLDTAHAGRIGGEVGSAVRMPPVEADFLERCRLHGIRVLPRPKYPAPFLDARKLHADHALCRAIVGMRVAEHEEFRLRLDDPRFDEFRRVLCQRLPQRWLRSQPARRSFRSSSSAEKQPKSSRLRSMVRNSTESWNGFSVRNDMADHVNSVMLAFCNITPALSSTALSVDSNFDCGFADQRGHVARS